MEHVTHHTIVRHKHAGLDKATTTYQIETRSTPGWTACKWSVSLNGRRIASGTDLSELEALHAITKFIDHHHKKTA